MTSSRRVKKGPGRRPQSAKRQRFMELRARGWSVRAAAREVGVSRSLGTNWTRGHNVYRNGVVVGFVAPLDRLAVRQISSRYLSQDERIDIADLRKSGLSLRAIAVRLGRAPSTISREAFAAVFLVLHVQVALPGQQQAAHHRSAVRSVETWTLATSR